MEILRPRPFLRWAGSKRKVIGKLVPYWSSSYRRYFEPFMGSATLFFSIGPDKATLSDINPELVEVFNWVKLYPREIHESLSKLRRGKQSYYRIRKLDSKHLLPRDRVARFIFLNRFCFNGLFRTNMLGKFNVPFSPAGTGGLPSLAAFEAASTALQNAQIMTGDFEAVLQNVKKNDFVYLDPPYAIRGRRVFREYFPEAFDISDLTRLSEVLSLIDRRGAHFVLSYLRACRF